MWDATIEHCNSFAKSWAWWMGTSIFDTTIVLAVVSLLWFVIRRRASPQLGCLLFLLIPLKLFIPLEINVPERVVSRVLAMTPRITGLPSTTPKPSSATHLRQTPSAAASKTTIDDGPSDPGSNASATPSIDVEAHSRLSSLAWLMLGWAAGVLMLLTRLVHSQLRFHHLIMSNARSIDPGQLPLDFKRLLRQVRLGRQIQVMESESVLSPVIWGLFRPMLILPAGISLSLSTGELEWVLLHELAHVRRRDLAVRCFQCLVTILHFVNPAIWLANRSINRLREYACDDMALSLGNVSQTESGEAFLGVMRYAASIQHRCATNLDNAIGVFESTARASCFDRMKRLLDTNRRVTVRLGFGSFCILLVTAALALPQIRAANPQADSEITPTSEPFAQQGLEKTILVDSATEAWQDSGVDVVAGQTLRITASGKVFYQRYGSWTGPDDRLEVGAPGYVNPDGVGNRNDGTQFTSNTILPATTSLTLIAKVGGTTVLGTGTPVPEGRPGKGAGFVGSFYCQRMPVMGRLFFAFNDQLRFFSDNSGSYKVAISVVSESSTRPSTGKHVRELARYFDGVKIAEPIAYRQLRVYPVLVEDVLLLRGSWLTLDKALSQGILDVREQPGGRMDRVHCENHSGDKNVFIMTGEVLAGGMQTRVVRQDVILAPGQKLDVVVFGVEAHRWAGGDKFAAESKTMLPQSILRELRKGADQITIWSEIVRNNSSLEAENATGSLEAALNSTRVRKVLDEVRGKILPRIPRGTVGLVFVNRGRALSADFFGNETLARALLPKLLDSYAVDYVILRGSDADHDGRGKNREAIDFFKHICLTDSEHPPTSGSGARIFTCHGGLLGDGVSLDDATVHYGVQVPLAEPGERNGPRFQQHPAQSVVDPSPAPRATAK